MRTFPSGAHVAEVEIDRETGSVEVVDYTAVDDIGNVINHVLADGQLHGGVMQGAGQAFGENCLYDEENGQLVAGSFMDYVMPRADLIRKIAAVNQVVPAPGNALGAKGAGEAGTTGAAPACMNAVVNALRAVGRGPSRHAGDAGAHLGGGAGGGRRGGCKDRIELTYAARTGATDALSRGQRRVRQ